MTEYACGYLFSDDLKHVVVIRKNRPDWQAGKLNGVGGHIEEGETPYDAMVREFIEEAGVPVEDWTQYTTIHGFGSKVHFFYAVSTEALKLTYSVTDEEILIYGIDCLEDKGVPNLMWTLNMALQHARGAGAPKEWEVVYHY